MQEAKYGNFRCAICTADHWLWAPNGSSVSPSKACSAFNLVAEGILGSRRRYHKSSHILCARTCTIIVDLAIISKDPKSTKFLLRKFTVHRDRPYACHSAISGIDYSPGCQLSAGTKCRAPWNGSLTCTAHRLRMGSPCTVSRTCDTSRRCTRLCLHLWMGT